LTEKLLQKELEKYFQRISEVRLTGGIREGKLLGGGVLGGGMLRGGILGGGMLR